MTEICVSNLNIIGSDNVLSSEWLQDIIWTNAEILLNGRLGTNCNGILYCFLKENALENVVWKMAAILFRHQFVNKSRVCYNISGSRSKSSCLQYTIWIKLNLHNRWFGTPFTNDFSLVIQIRWKLHFALIQVVAKWSLWNFAHGTTAVLSWSV